MLPISLSWSSANARLFPSKNEDDKAIIALMNAYRGLPRHIARKHLKAAMRKTLKPAVPVLRKYTPPTGVKRGRRAKGEKPRSSGDLRRSVTTKAGQTGKNDAFDSFVWGVVGYRSGWQSRKAIWLQYGTERGVKPYRMIEAALTQIGPVCGKTLEREMAAALKEAVAERDSGKNPGYRG